MQIILMTVSIKALVDEQFAYARYLWDELRNPHWNNYFYWLLGLSLLVFIFELLVPWRKEQKAFRKDFWLDFSYMFFNIFIFQLIGYKFVASLSQVGLDEVLATVGASNILANRLTALPVIAQLFILFIFRDFIQWWIHRLLHKSDFLWEFHKVHHSVEEMGFAAHLRFHWMETVIYNTLQFIPLGLLGFTLDQYIAVYIVSILIGHLNHANIKLPLGPLRYIFNNPQMHIWHHTKTLPVELHRGCNFGLSLSCWDYLFGTAYLPASGRDNKLGFKDLKTFPKSFLGQVSFGFRGKKKADP